VSTSKAASSDTPATRSLEDAVCVVTGGAKGIGAAISEQMAELGGRVVIVDRDADAAETLAARLDGSQAAAIDVSDYEAVRACIDGLERVDVLVNNAGWDRVQPFLDNDPALWDQLLAINLKGVFNFTHAALPRMAEAGAGRIVNVASDAGRVGSSGEAVYSACKGGVIAFTKSIAREAARHRVTVNCVCPGPTETPLLAEIKQDERAARTMDAIVKATPLRRLAQPGEIAAAAVFFATGPEHVTGQVLSVSGGLTMAG
jgi:2-hydroxycyclohexanecarboxyl-CoA dehydrogenase